MVENSNSASDAYLRPYVRIFLSFLFMEDIKMLFVREHPDGKSTVSISDAWEIS